MVVMMSSLFMDGDVGLIGRVGEPLLVTLLSSFPSFEQIVASDPALEINDVLLGDLVHNSAGSLHLGHGEVLLGEESFGFIDRNDAVVVGVTSSESSGLLTVINNSQGGVR
jgi:hypothetical protein